MDEVDEHINALNELMEDGKELQSEEEGEHDFVLDARDCYHYQLGKKYDNILMNDIILIM